MSDKEVLDTYVGPTNEWIERIQELAAEHGHTMLCGDMLAIALFAVAVHVGHAEDDGELANANNAVRRELAKTNPEVDQTGGEDPHERTYRRAFAFIDGLFQLFPDGLDADFVIRVMFNVMLNRGGELPDAGTLAELADLARDDTATHNLHQSFGQIVSGLEFDPETGKLL